MSEHKVTGQLAQPSPIIPKALSPWSLCSPAEFPQPVVSNSLSGGPEEDASPQTEQEGAGCQRDPDHEGKQASQYCQLYRQVGGSGVIMGMFIHTLQAKG